MIQCTNCHRWIKRTDDYCTHPGCGVVTQHELEWRALRAAYDAYLIRFHATHGLQTPHIPLTPQQFAAGAELSSLAWEKGKIDDVSDLQDVMLLGE